MATAIFFILIALQLLLDIISFFLMLRILLVLFLPDIYNPIIEFIFKITRWTNSLKRIIPEYKKFDIPAFVALIIVEIVKIILIIWIHFRKVSFSYGMIAWLMGDILNLFANVLFYALVLRALLHWLGATRESVLYELLYIITEPLLKPLRRFVPIIKNVDVLAIVLAILIKAIAIILFVPLMKWGELSLINSISGFR